jgi:hypothetical protein
MPEVSGAADVSVGENLRVPRTWRGVLFVGTAS